MTFAAVEQIECIRGCDSSGVAWISWVVGGGGLLIALGSMLLAWKSSKASEAAADAAEESLSIARTQHQAFVKTLRAHANFAVSIYQSGDGLVESDANRVELQWLIKIENTGDKPAKEVVVIFVAPRAVRGLAWLEDEGDSLLSERGGAHDVRENLVAADGSEDEAQAVVKIARHIGRFTKYSRVGGIIDLSSTVGESIVIPVQVKVGSDDLPEDMRYIQASAELKVKRVAVGLTPSP
jgi:hypothetical protein